jgi:predicted ATPase/DNA-binding CsgD family transcriptional regulator
VDVVGTVLTRRESEVLALVGRHLTNAEIAAELFISVRTVEAHVAALLRKTQLPDRRTLARLATTEEHTERGSLPVPATPFIGRAAERRELMRAISEHRLVTAIGPGGIGKSRLAVSVATEVADQRRDGAWFVDLVRVTDPDSVTAAVAEAVGVSQQWAATPEEAMVGSLCRREGLLVLDNCEHLLDGVRECVDRIVAGCPGITVLATSRTRLMSPSECLYPVPGLSVDDGAGDAVALFVARVRDAAGEEVTDTHRVAALCMALDGIALAIELAAARYATLGLDGLEEGLHEQLRFFSVGSRTAGRHRSLRDAIGWSYDLLDARDQELLRGIAVFASWFDVSAAVAVVAAPGSSRAPVADGLARLADHSLLVVRRGAPTCYRALETIRQYGREQLEALGELAAAEGRHEAWCRAETAVLADAEPDDEWCTRFDAVVDDIRTAVRWSGADRQRRAGSASFAGELAGLLFLRGRPAESQRRYEQAAELAPTPADRVGYLRLAAGAAASRNVGSDTLRLLRAAADTALQLGDRAGATRDLAWMSIYMDRLPGIMVEPPIPGEAAALRAEAEQVSDGSAPAEAAIATARAWGSDFREPGAFELSRTALGLADRAGDSTLECAALDHLCTVYYELDQPRKARPAIERRLWLIGTMPLESRTGFEFVDTMAMASDTYVVLGDLVYARDYADRLASLPFFREERLGIARRLIVDALAGYFDDVIRNAEVFRVGWEHSGRPAAAGLAKAAYAAAMVHGMLGHDEQRSLWRQITLDLGASFYSLDGCATGWAPTFDALLALHRGEPGIAIDRLRADVDDEEVRRCPAIDWRPWYAAAWAEAAVLAGWDDARDRISRARRATRDNPITAAMVERAVAIEAGNRSAIAALAATFAALGCPYQEDRTQVLAGSCLS